MTDFNDAWGSSWGGSWAQTWAAGNPLAQVIVRGQRKASKRKKYDEELDRDAFQAFLRRRERQRKEEEFLLSLLFD
jgi:hypothetical protein